MDPLVGGLPAAGQSIVDDFLAEWMPMWSDAARLAESTAILEKPVRATLEPITLQQLDEVLLTYPSKAGLGADCFHPGPISLLTDDFRLRVIDFMHLWESTPEPPLAWTTLIVFRPKPEGGYRPIGLTYQGLVQARVSEGQSVGAR